MKHQDRFGNALETASETARAAYDAGMDLHLAGTYGAVEAFERAVEADEGFALGFAGLSRARMMGGDMAGAKAAIAEARAKAAGLPERVDSHIACFETLLAGQPVECRTRVERHVQSWPRDAMIAQICTNVFGLIGFSGHVGREAALLAYTSALMPHYADDWWMQSMHALSLCETGQIDASHALMAKSLDRNPRNANGAHFKAHALYEDGQTAAGRAYLSDWMQEFDPRSVMHGHLRWHEALWALHDGDFPAMWAAVDNGIGPGASQGLPINIVTDTAAILFRAELAGEAVPPSRWAALSDYTAQCFPKPGQSFVDMHAALAHAMAGDGARLAVFAEAETGFASDLVRPVAAAWRAMARQAWEEARDALVPVLAQSERIGGSRAQRDLLELSYAAVLMRLGQSGEARRVLSLRRPVLVSANGAVDAVSDPVGFL